ncbi:MAG: DNA alkylation repair protein [Treponemataceae bacterium]|nr:DNA alkylation repair protein [Treponemataceae bacterium]
MLFEKQDRGYRDFQATLIPTVEPENIIGVRTPELKKLAKDLIKESDIDRFLSSLPHKFFDENQLHAFLLCQMKDFEECIEKVDLFLPYIDNWASCDQLTPPVFKKKSNREKLIPYIKKWICDTHTYTVRFAIKCLMQYFLDDDFSPSYLELVAGVKSDEYYVNMMKAWYFATSLAKQYDKTIPLIEERKLDSWVHGKTIQKALESYRISLEKKDYLRSLR